jgi:hypothetical protein
MWRKNSTSVIILAMLVLLSSPLAIASEPGEGKTTRSAIHPKVMPYLRRGKIVDADVHKRRRKMSLAKSTISSDGDGFFAGAEEDGDSFSTTEIPETTQTKARRSLESDSPGTLDSVVTHLPSSIALAKPTSSHDFSEDESEDISSLSSVKRARSESADTSMSDIPSFYSDSVTYPLFGDLSVASARELEERLIRGKPSTMASVDLGDEFSIEIGSGPITPAPLEEEDDIEPLILPDEVAISPPTEAGTKARGSLEDVEKAAMRIARRISPPRFERPSSPMPMNEKPTPREEVASISRSKWDNLPYVVASLAVLIGVIFVGNACNRCNNSPIVKLVRHPFVSSVSSLVAPSKNSGSIRKYQVIFVLLCLLTLSYFIIRRKK